MTTKKTLKGRFLQTGLLMLFASVLVAFLVTCVVLTIFMVREPNGEQMFRNALLLVFGGELIGPERLIPYILLEGALLCGAVAGVCIWLTSRLSGRLTVTLRTLCQAADDLRDGDLDFDILSCEEKELDDLCRSLESVRQRLKAAANAEARAREERGLLMANLSHDLRTPITTIKGYVEGIRDGIAATPEKEAHYLSTIYQKALTMEKLVRNMTDFSEYELGRMVYHFEQVELVAFLADLADEYRAETAERGLTFRSDLPPAPLFATADRGKLKRVLDNLISNATKYSRPDGIIELSAEAYEGGLVLQVSDNGQGIRTEALHHVFDSFFRADAARSGTIPGSGLGLAICKSIVESHHGKIWLNSEEGTGTRAFVYLPLNEEGRA